MKSKKPQQASTDNNFFEEEGDEIKDGSLICCYSSSERWKRILLLEIEIELILLKMELNSIDS